MQQRNFLLFIALSLMIFVMWSQLKMALWPPPPKPLKKDPIAEVEPNRPPVRPDPATGLAAGPWAGLVKPAQPPKPVQPPEPAQPPKPAVVALPEAVPATPDEKLITLGDGDSLSRFHLRARLDPRGAGVREVMLNKFQQADASGRPVWRNGNKADGEQPLVLVPGEANSDPPANALFHYRDVEDRRPLDTLGKAAWTVLDRQDEQTDDGRQQQSVSFQTEVQGVRITKTFTLIEGEYHLGLTVKLARSEMGEGGRRFRYQLAGAQGLPVEGDWYTQTFRNALIAEVHKGNVWRNLQDLRQIGVWDGGEEVLKKENRIVRYAAVAVQYFTSAIVVDDQQSDQGFLKQARPTLEKGVARGKFKAFNRQRGIVTLTLSDGKDHDYFSPEFAFDAFAAESAGESISFYYRYDDDGRAVIVPLIVPPEAGDRKPTIWYEDITVRVSTEPIELKPGSEVVHKYLLYNGPVKPSLLAGMTGVNAVPPALVDRYAYTLALNTLTDYHSPGKMGEFASAIYFTDLVIKCTNLIHAVLGGIHWLVPSYGVCIVLLTIMVRGAMFPLSRKQALISLRMQELAPELKKLQEKFKDDRQGMGQAQMELYRKHGINPFGTCWLLMLQMPIFMGLYYALQESIQFRLAPFWPTWVINLAAPDMMIYWGEGIPVISKPEDYGGLLYLGPYFNLLPIIAVVFMMIQQKMTMPPPVDEQQKMQHAMMKYMMAFFGLMFYKVASGLCLYFIASTMWGFAERKLLPKKKAEGLDKSAPDGTIKAIVVPKPARKRRSERGRKDDEAPSVLGRLKELWAKLLKQAEKKR